MIQEERVRDLSERPAGRGRYVLYWIQASPRVACNHAYQYAVRMADRLSLPLLACFDLIPGYPGATAPHYRFMAEGLVGLTESLRDQGVQLIIMKGSPGTAPLALGGEAALVVTDRGYLRFQEEWRGLVAGDLGCRLTRVETNSIVPVESASPKEEWSAATFRARIAPLLGRFLVPLREKKPSRSSLEIDPGVGKGVTPGSLGIWHVPEEYRTSGAPHPGRPLPWRGGEDAALALLGQFIRQNLARYPQDRNDPLSGVLSCMSPYLHFGQISPLLIAETVRAQGSPSAGAYLEELIVRRELGINFVHYNPLYDQFSGLPEWARKTLSAHSRDRREYVYRMQEFESAATHDPCWNAAQREMLTTGKMHGYMRMYWGKKILEWSETPEEAYRIACHLNDRYELDGRDPNGYAGIAWCFGKHDRGWKERPVFGTIRFMNAAGLERKFDTGRYVEQFGGDTPGQ